MKQIKVGRIVVIVAAFVAISFSARGESVARWNLGTAQSGDWGIPTNWSDPSGDTLSVAPTNGEIVIFPDLPLAAWTTPFVSVGTGAWSGSGYNRALNYPSVDPTVASLKGPSQYVIRHTAKSNMVVQNLRRFTVSDSDEFFGWFTADDGRACLTLDATDARDVEFPNVGAAARLTVDVPGSGARASVESVYESGMLEKAGEGNLIVKSTRGVGTNICIDDGTVTLNGVGGSDGIEAILSRADVHLDASVAGSLETFSKDGLTCVARWNDCRGNGFYAVTNAYQSTSTVRIPYCHAPFVSGSKSPTGLPFVDFGTMNYAANEWKLGELYGPTNCYLAFSSSQKNIREAFYVVETPMGARRCTVLGSTVDSWYWFKATNADTDNSLFARSGGYANVWAGDIAVNGDSVASKDIQLSQLKNCYVVSVGTSGDACANALACDRYYRECSGGVRIGELLLFSSPLTRAERQRVNDYLNSKWRTGEMMRDAGDVIVATASASVGVPSNRVSRVRSVVAAHGFVKRGGGALVVDRVHPSGANIVVEDGAVVFNGASPVASTNAPATGAYVWLDATATGTLVSSTYSGQGDTKYVSEWKDCREGTNIVAISTVSGSDATAASAPNMPFETMVGGMKAVSFGKTSDGNLSMMRLPGWNTASETYAGFAVIRCNSVNSGCNFFGSSNMDMLRHYSALVSTLYVSPYSVSARWAIDGEPVDPWSLTADQTAKTCGSKAGFAVISFSSAFPLRVDGLAVDRVSGGTKGDMTIGEYLVYHRPITEQERINTEAYLMAKWLHAEHPERTSTGKIGSMTFSPEAPMSFGGGGDVSIEVLSGGNGGLVKQGEGSCEVVRNNAAISSLCVEEGSLSLPASSYELSLETNMLYHFDASIEQTVQTVDGNKVVSWNDVRGSSVASASSANPVEYSTIAQSYPTLCEVETRTGVFRPMIDFGAKNSADSSFLKLNKRYSGVREVVAVFADANGNRDTPFVSDYGGTYFYLRGWNQSGQMFPNETYAASFTGGHLGVDGMPVVWSDVYPEGVHVVTLSATASTIVGSFGDERTTFAGGCRIGEQIAFPRQLLDEERNYLERTLMTKWLGMSPLAFTNSVDSLHIGNGAELKIVGKNIESVVDAGVVSGEGALSASRLIAHNVTVGPLDAANRSPLSVVGTVELTEGATVEIQATSIRAVRPGRYALMCANAFEKQGSVVVDSPLLSRFSISLEVEGGVLYANLLPKGLLLWVR